MKKCEQQIVEGAMETIVEKGKAQDEEGSRGG